MLTTVLVHDSSTNALAPPSAVEISTEDFLLAPDPLTVTAAIPARLRGNWPVSWMLTRQLAMVGVGAGVGEGGDADVWEDTQAVVRNAASAMSVPRNNANAPFS